MITHYITFFRFVKWYMVSGFVFWEIGEGRCGLSGKAEEPPHALVNRRGCGELRYE
jgi:hypothetical protein